jgi:hypothetical protein
LWLALLLAPLLLAPARAEASHPLYTGVFDPQTFAQANPLAFERVQKAGATFVRIVVSWQQIAPNRRPASGNPQNPEDSRYDYRWGNTDQQVEEAVHAGLTPVLDVVDTPDWAHRFPDCFSAQVCAPDPGDFGDFATAAARRYDGSDGEPRVHFWQAWNEANIHQFLMPQFIDGESVSADLYRDMLNAFASAVKDVDPDNLVITSGMAPLKRPGSTAPLAFTRRLLCMTGVQRPRPVCEKPVQFDILSTHPYTPGSPVHRCAGSDDLCLAELPNLRRLLHAADLDGQIHSSLDPVAFWVTEFSWDTDPPDPGGVPLRRHARWTAQALYEMWHSGVSAVFWFLLRDQPGSGKAPNIFQSGLYLRGHSGLDSDRPKPSLRAFRFPFVAFPHSSHQIFVWGRTPTSEPGPVIVEVRRHSVWRKVATVRANGDGIFRRLLRVAPSGDARAVVQDPYTEDGEADSIPFAIRNTPDMSLHVFGSTFPTGRVISWR